MPSKLKSAIIEVKFEAGDFKMTNEQMQAVLEKIQTLQCETQNME